MATPILIDTDMGVDDAVAVSLALGAETLDVVGIASVGGNVNAEQATTNIARLVRALDSPERPRVARGCDQDEADLEDATHIFGADGFGEVDAAPADDLVIESVEDLYNDLLDRHAGELVIVAIGPLTNLARLHEGDPTLLGKAAKIVVMGGAVWCKGNVTPTAEFNFYRDPAAADCVLKVDVPTTLVPLDVTRQVAMDESHVAHLVASGTKAGDFLGRIIPFALGAGGDDQTGRFLVHDALAVGTLLWPELFMGTVVGLDVQTDGKERGRCTPGVGNQAAHRVSVSMSIKSVDFLENLLESLCRERFVV